MHGRTISTMTITMLPPPPAAAPATPVSHTDQARNVHVTVRARRRDCEPHTRFSPTKTHSEPASSPSPRLG